MKTPILTLAALLALTATRSTSTAAEEKPSAPEQKRSLRVLAAPDRDLRPSGPREMVRQEKIELETVAFLGVETGAVSATTAAQLGLTRGTGLVVNHVLPKSAADGVLQEHDILLKLDDQILIETRQLAVLIRTHKEGDDVTVTYLRAGQKATAKLKLGKTEVPKVAGGIEAGTRFEFFGAPQGPEAGRAEVDRVLSLMQRSPSGEPLRVQIDRNAGPGIRAMAINTANSNLVFTDGEGTLELSTKDGVKSLVATGPKGEPVFSGPITTPAERDALPAGVRERLEKLEGMRDVTFRTDGDFRGAGTRVIRPRGISLPIAPAAPAATPARGPVPAFF
ncbi:PDZ domain-containing protein [Horticoccus sp. 23ND18S-11]|uniref:PDZ domain-containing protein n=1 Tax=Horticoccus sp. 23ND18S-11 TaxID=3391832 RepID=UPI0039C93046